MVRWGVLRTWYSVLNRWGVLGTWCGVVMSRECLRDMVHCSGNVGGHRNMVRRIDEVGCPGDLLQCSDE